MALELDDPFQLTFASEDDELGDGFGSFKANSRLNDQQRAAVTAPLGVVQVIAGAGTGKTSGVILPRASYLYNELPGTVCILAFNKAVQNELAAKVRTELNSAVSSNTKIYTNDALAYKLVMKYKSLLSLPDNTELVGKPWVQYKWLRERASQESDLSNSDRLPNFRAEFNQFDDNIFKALFEIEERARVLQRPVSSFVEEFSKVIGHLKDGVAEDFVKWHKINRVLFGKLLFRDLMPLANDLPDWCFENLGFTHVLIDEAQDLNIEQHEFCKKLSKFAESMTFVGDPCQCIYKWRGARPDLFINLSKNYPGCQVFPLEFNYRCDQPILDVANDLLINQLDAPIMLRAPEARPGKSPMRTNYRGLVPWIKEQLQANAKPEDIAVLIRTNSQAMWLELELSKARIPYNCKSGSFFEDQAAIDILSYFRLLRGTREFEDWKTIVNHVKFLGKETAEASWKTTKGDPRTLKGYPEACRFGRMKQRWDDLLKQLDDFSYYMGNSPPNVIIDEIYNTCVLQAWQDRWPDDPSRFGEAVEIKNALRDWASDFNTVDELLIALNRIGSTDDDEDEETQTGVTISTVHKAKGLEWDHVIVWNVGLGLFPLLRPGSDYEEELCILYVAVTRARKSLVFIRNIDKVQGDLKATQLMQLVDSYCYLEHAGDSSTVQPSDWMLENRGQHELCAGCPFSLTCLAQSLTL